MVIEWIIHSIAVKSHIIYSKGSNTLTFGRSNYCIMFWTLFSNFRRCNLWDSLTYFTFCPKLLDSSPTFNTRNYAIEKKLHHNMQKKVRKTRFNYLLKMTYNIKQNLILISSYYNDCKITSLGYYIFNTNGELHKHLQNLFLCGWSN